MSKKIFANVNVDKDNKHLTIAVYADFVDKLREILSTERPIGKSFTNISKVYVLLYWINSIKQFHIDKEDLAMMAYARHRESLNKALDILEAKGLLKRDLHLNVYKSRSYYTYKVYPFTFDLKTKSTTIFDFDIPDITFCNLFCIQKQNPILNIPSFLPLHIYRTDSQKGVEFESFLGAFRGWYDELDFGDKIVPKGYFSEKDGRFYHRFHTVPKEERLSVKWEGEKLVEVWDAHSAFFIVLGFYLKYIVQYQCEEDRIVVTREADKMLNLAISDQFYTSIMRYHNQHSHKKINRETAKVLAHKYVNKSYSSLFKKNGERSKYQDSVRCRYVDEFFQNNYPCIRDWLLYYQRHKELKDIEIYRGEEKKIIKNQSVSISNIHRDIMPYEFTLISMGLCKDLYDTYGIKSVTVHDAIYIKESDTATINSDIIDNLLCKRLGLSPKTGSPLRCIKLF